MEALESRQLLAVDLTLTLAVQGNVEEVSPGETLTYELTYTNAGDETASGVVIQARQPRGVSLVEGDLGAGDPAWSCDSSWAGSVCTLEIGDLARGASATVPLKMAVEAELLPRVGSISQVAWIRGDRENGWDPTPRNNVAVERTPVKHVVPDLEVSLNDGDTEDSDVEVSPGDRLTYTVSYANTGPVAATGVELVVRIPPGTTKADDAPADGEWTRTTGLAGDEYTFTVGALAASEDGTATLTVTVDSSLPQFMRQLTAAAQIRAGEDSPADPTPRNNADIESTAVVYRVPDLQLAIEAGELAEDGPLVYTMTLANDGPVDASGVELSLILPRGVTAITAGTAWTCEDSLRGGQQCSLVVGGLAAGESKADVTLSVAIDSDQLRPFGSIYTVGRITDDGAHGHDPTPWNNVALQRTRLPDSGRPWGDLWGRFRRRFG